MLAQELSQQRPDHPLKGMAVLRLNCLRLDRQVRYKTNTIGRTHGYA